jgi:hypothetical protein
LAAFLALVLFAAGLVLFLALVFFFADDLDDFFFLVEADSDLERSLSNFDTISMMDLRVLFNPASSNTVVALPCHLKL